MGTTERVLSGSKTKGSTATYSGSVKYFYQGINAKEDDVYFGSLIPRIQSGPRMALFRGTQRLSDKHFDDTAHLPDTFSAVMSSSFKKNGWTTWTQKVTSSVGFGTGSIKAEGGQQDARVKRLPSGSWIGYQVDVPSLGTNPVHLQLQFERPITTFGQPPSVPHEGPYVAVNNFNAVSFIEADERSMWPVNLTNVGSILGREFDGVIEPLDIRSEILGLWNTKHLGHSVRGALVGAASHTIFGSKEIKDRWNKYDPGPAPFLDAPMLFGVTASLKTSTRSKEFDFGKLTSTLTKLGDIHLAMQGYQTDVLSRENPWQEKDTDAVAREPLFVHNPPVVLALNDGIVGYDLTPSSSRSQKRGGFFVKTTPLANHKAELGGMDFAANSTVGTYSEPGLLVGAHRNLIAWWRMQQPVNLLTGSYRTGAGTIASPFVTAHRLYANDTNRSYLEDQKMNWVASLTISGSMILSDSSGNGITASVGDRNRYYGGLPTALTGNLWCPMSASRFSVESIGYSSPPVWSPPAPPASVGGAPGAGHRTIAPSIKGGVVTPSGSLIFGAFDDRITTSTGGGGFEITDRVGKFSFAGMVSGSSANSSTAGAGRRDRPFSLAFWVSQKVGGPSGSFSVSGGTGKGMFGGNAEPTLISKEDAGEQTSGGGWNSNRRQWRITLPNQGENIKLTLYTDDSNYIELCPPGGLWTVNRGSNFGYWSKADTPGVVATTRWLHILITYNPTDVAQTATTALNSVAFYFNGGGGDAYTNNPRYQTGHIALNSNEVGTYSGMSGSMAQGGPPYPTATGKPIAGSAAAKPLLIGPDLNQGYRAQIADLAIWNTALDHSDAKALYRAGIQSAFFDIKANSGQGVSKLPDIMEALAKMDYPDDGNLNVRDTNATHGFYFSKKAGSIVYGDE